MKKILFPIALFLLGLLVGAYLFSHVQPRGFLDIKECRENCLKPNEYAGIVGSVVTQKMPGLLPNKIMETDKTIVVDYPDYAAREKLHYVAIPKIDIKNLGEYTSAQKEYLDDTYKCLAQIINEKNLQKYQVYSTGPALQNVAYWHFHLVEYK